MRNLVLLNRSSFNRLAAYDVEVKDDSYILSVDLPGVGKSNIDIETRDGLLIVTGKRKNFFEKNEKELELSRSFNLTKEVDVDKIEAHYENGVLNILLPKKEQVKPRKITISGSKDGGLLNKLFRSSEATKVA